MADILAAIGKIIAGLWELGQKEPKGALTSAILLLIVASLTAWIGLNSFGPVLLRATWDPVVFHYPRIQEFEDISRQVPEQLHVLIQRKVAFIDHWGLSDDPERECVQMQHPENCDESHIFESWTVLVPSHPDLTPLATETYTAAGGRNVSFPEILTGQTLTPLTGAASALRNWTIEPKLHPDSDTDTILWKRDLIGAFQPSGPDPRSPPSCAPETRPCEQDGIGLSLRNLTNSAEIIMTRTEEAPGFKLGSAQAYVQRGRCATAEKLNDAEIGNLKVETAHKIYWFVPPMFIKKLTDQHLDASLWVVWDWDPPIKGKGLCKKSS
ncbi:MAG TPA: hypothetical protein VN823_05880 [Stellaceae bacterium]|nr:hypothetical protein [Stellaceae bacterium]